MHLSLYKALVGINIPPEQATEVVEAMEAHINERVTSANQAVLATLTAMRAEGSAQFMSLQARQEADTLTLKSQLDELGKGRDRNIATVRWMVGLLFGVPAMLAASLGVLKIFGVL